ncbi:MAG: undecaprenyldiphospho-muramoylpentapeptide beta-N-acetylglucosaminyltransferase [Bacilli bacterium]
MRVIISAGGTGGHIYPALAIINKIKEKDKNAKILYIGTTDRMEKDIIPKMGIDYIGIKIDGLHRKLSLKNVRSAFLLGTGILKCKQIIKKFNPDVVIGVGGYVTAPVIYAAKKMGIKCCLHEQNSTFGMTNRFLEKYADKIFVSFKSSLEQVKDKSKAIYTGNPCSESALKSPLISKEKFGLSLNKKLVLIVMGSLGSNTIGNKMKQMLTLFNNKDYEVMFVTGKKYFDEYKTIKYTNNIKIVPYLENMTSLLKNTDVLVSRAGASTLSEISSLNVASILIPSPYVTENHQLKNALDLVGKKAADLLEEKDLEGDILLRMVEKILDDQLYSKKMKDNLRTFEVKNSASMIYDEIKFLVGDKNGRSN